MATLADLEPETADASRAHTSADDRRPSEVGRGRRWDRSTREIVERLAEEERGNAQSVRRRLSEEHGLQVPKSTVALWVKNRRRPSAPTIGGLADRALRLLSSEMDALERSSGKLDVDRLGKIAQTLKTLDGLSRRQARAGARTLSELSESEASPKVEESVLAGSQS